MATTGRVYGTGGINVTSAGAPWTTPENVDGAASGDYATIAVAFPSDSSDYVATSIAATPIGGSVVSVTLGCRIKTSGAPVASTCAVTVALRNSSGALLGSATINSGFGTAEADIEGRLIIASGKTFSQIKTMIEAGVTAAAGPKGLTVAVSNLDGTPLTFSLASAWLDVSYSKGPIYVDASANVRAARAMLIDVVNP